MTSLKSRRPAAVAALSAAALVAVSLTTTGTAAGAELTNVALAENGGRAFASGQELPDRWGPEMAIDGDDGNGGTVHNPEPSSSRWNSEPGNDDAWIAVELAEPTVVEYVEIQWANQCALAYHLEVSDDGETWTDATDTITQTAADCAQRDRQELDVETPVKFVRMQAEQPRDQWGYSLFEFEVWASTGAAEPSVGTNVALAANGGDVSASGTEDGTQWTPERAIDGITAGNAPDGVQSRWSSNHADDAWIAVELAEPTDVHHVTIYWEDACAAEYHLEVSADGEEWTDATGDIRPTCGTVDRQTLDVEGPVSFVRMQASERTPIGGGLWGVSLWELEVWDGPEPEAVLPDVALVPQPVELTELDDAPFVLEADASIVADEDATGAGELLAEVLRPSTGYDLPVVSSGASAGDIVLDVDPDADYGDLTGNEEAYRLEVGAEGVSITGASDHAVFNGTQTLRQLLPAFVEADEVVNTDWVAPAVEILDGPRYEFRGMMLDVARSFLTVEEVKDTIDAMAAYKISRVHFHLTDDQGWRIEITNEGKAEDDPIDYSLLTEVSGRTGMSQQGYLNELGRTGYYTQEEYSDIVAYAAERHIEVVPEIDIPGHTNAVLHAIPELNTAGSHHEGTPEQPTAPFNGTGNVGYSYLDPYNELSYTFVEHVLGQLAAITPGEHLHIGGDESHRMTQVHGHEGYVHFVERAVEIVHDLGKKPIGWNEYSEATLNEGDGVHYWIGGTQHVERAVTQEGAQALISRGGNSYLDMKYNAKTPIGLTWACAGTCDFPQYYNWDPATVIPNVGDEHIMGNSAPMWSETIRGASQAQFLAFPRAFSHAEIGWTPQAQRDVSDFATRMAAQGARLLVDGKNFYDGNKAAWDYELAGTDVAAAPGREVTLAVGQLAAPGTKASEDGSEVAVDTVDDADGVSASALDEPLSATIDFGDGSEPVAATFVTAQERDALHAGSVYHLTAEHAYAEAGTYEGTVTASDGTVIPFTATVAAGTPDPAPPVQPWVPTEDPDIELGADTATADGRVAVSIAGFEPGVHVMLTLGDAAINSLVPDEDGTLEEWLWIPAGSLNGEHVLTATQGEGEDARTASTTVTVEGGRDAVPNAIPRSEYSIADVSSEETAAENTPATNAIDGNPSTFWHSRYSGGAEGYPHHITIDLGDAYDVEALEYLPRLSNVNGPIEDYRVYVHDEVDEWGEAVAEGSFPDSRDFQLVTFTPTEGRYVTLEALSSIAGNAFAAVAELNVGGLPAGEEPTEEPTTEEPTEEPTTEEPTEEPTTEEPTEEPTTEEPTEEPTTEEPTTTPTEQPTDEPTDIVPVVSIDPRSAAVGETVTITGTGFWPGEGIELSIDGDVVATATAGPEGAFSVEITVPEGTAPGEYLVLAVGLDSGHEVTVSLTVTGAATGDDDADDDSDDELPSTGAPAAGLALAALVILGAGAATLLARRNQAQV